MSATQSTGKRFEYDDQQVHKAGLASLVTGKYKSKQHKGQERWEVVTMSAAPPEQFPAPTPHSSQLLVLQHKGWSLL